MMALSSKLTSQKKAFTANMVVNALMMLHKLLQLKMIAIKKVQTGALEEFQLVLEEFQLVAGTVFKKTSQGASGSGL
jgi:T-complex protein 1 subunit eta